MGRYESRTALEEWHKRDGAKPAKIKVSYQFCMTRRKNCQLKLANGCHVRIQFWRDGNIYWVETNKVQAYDENSLPNILMKVAAAGGVRTCTLL